MLEFWLNPEVNIHWNFLPRSRVMILVFTDHIVHHIAKGAFMAKNLTSAALLVVLAFAFSSLAFAQDMKKDETAKMEKKEMMGEMKVGSCSPECGFMVRSHNEAEVTEMLKMHAKKQHNMEMSDKDAMAKIKSAKHMEMKMEKKMEKMEKREEK